jgi:hypothetical protein
MSRLNHYRAALYLCAVIALTDASWILFFVIPRLPTHAEAFFMPLAATLMTAVGLMLRSNLIRYFGGVFMVIWGAALLWPLISGGTAPYSRPNSLAFFSYYAFRGALSLLTAALLLFSKQFANEFAKRRDSAPRYVGYLRLLLIGAIVAAGLFATLNDIVKLADSP